MMKKIIPLLVILFALIGCGGMSFYSTNLYVITAIQTDSGLPAMSYPVRLIYPYDHYGIFYIWNAPRPFESFLDKQGQLEIPISSFSHPQLVVGSTVFTLNDDFFKEGKQPFKHPYPKDDERYRRDREAYVSLKLPATKYAEVDIVLEKRKTK
jgi:hypothetical protein